MFRGIVLALSLVVSAPAFADEVGDDADSARSLTLGSAYNGRLETEDDEDWFVFAAVAGYSYGFELINTNSTASSPNFYHHVYYSNREFNGFAKTVSRFEPRRYSFLMEPSDGVVHIRVRFDSGQWNGTPADYRITVYGDDDYPSFYLVDSEFVPSGEVITGTSNWYDRADTFIAADGYVADRIRLGSIETNPAECVDHIWLHNTATVTRRSDGADVPAVILSFTNPVPHPNRSDPCENYSYSYTPAVEDADLIFNRRNVPFGPGGSVLGLDEQTFTITGLEQGQEYSLRLDGETTRYSTTTRSRANLTVLEPSSPSSTTAPPFTLTWTAQQSGEAEIEVGAFGAYRVDFIDPDVSSEVQLRAAVLPEGRAVQIGDWATFFATIINVSDTDAVNCRIEPDGWFMGHWGFAPTDPATNARSGDYLTGVDIPARGSGTFVAQFRAIEEVNARQFTFGFECDNASPAPVFDDVNTFRLDVPDFLTPDIVMANATANGGGIARLASPQSTTFMAVSALNIGAGGNITFVPEARGDANLVLTVCRTDPTSGQCETPRTGEVSVYMGQNATVTLAVFASAQGEDIAFRPATNRVALRANANHPYVRPLSVTSVAVTTAQ